MAEVTNCKKTNLSKQKSGMIFKVEEFRALHRSGNVTIVKISDTRHKTAESNLSF